MNVRNRLLGGFLLIAIMVAVTGGIALHADSASARQAAITEAVQVAGGTTFDHDTDDQVGATIADGRSRTFVEVSVDYPDGIRQVVVPLVGPDRVTLGAVILEYTPLYDQMMASTRHAQTIILVAGLVCIALVLLLGYLTATSITRRINGLTAGVQVIRDGDYSWRVALRGRDEISRLGSAVNDMAGRLERSAREILAKEYTDSILANAGEGICGVDAHDRITFANEAAGRLTGLGVDGLLGQQVMTVPPDADRTGGDGAEREGRLQRPDGTSVQVAYTVSPIGKGGRRIGAVIVLRDVSRQRALEHDLRHQALHDGLTGLPNRKLFLDRLDHAVTRARATGETVGVLFLDLDGFKRINDSLGHAAGDLLLRTAAERLTGVLRAPDTIARLGGDEFAVLLENADRATVDRLVQGCLDALARPFVVHGREAVISVSIGVVVEAARYEDADEALRDADVAMYAAKAQGKARFEIFESRMHEQLLDRLDMESRLRDAVHRGELRLHLQPVVSVPDRRINGVEALVRWADPEHGLQQPGSFIPLAEETGLIVEIDRWMLLEACHTVKQWQDSAPHTAPDWVSVNLSAANLEVPDLTDRVAYALATSGLPPSCLVLELTETVLMRDIAVTSARLEELRLLGVKIAIDDFGTGYSSLGYLRDIPVDVLKVDRSFITDLAGNARQQELVNAVVQLGHTLGLRVVAEGIEDEDQLRALTTMGCRFAQGYHLGRPEPAAELIVHLAADTPPSGPELIRQPAGTEELFKKERPRPTVRGGAAVSGGLSAGRRPRWCGPAR
ncbi:putative bifunctional diguanylate cyclase/phosphodiesterase [Micromonosporaceae bacterium Da 78-11]